MIAIRCACASICQVIRQALSRACRSGSIVDLRQERNCIRARCYDPTRESNAIMLSGSLMMGVGRSEFSRLFEPFYTTKPNGMGMGLTICRSIIEAPRRTLVGHGLPATRRALYGQ